MKDGVAEIFKYNSFHKTLHSIDLSDYIDRHCNDVLLKYLKGLKEFADKNTDVINFYPFMIREKIKELEDAQKMDDQ
jgi:hypothetical protein